MLFQSHTTQPTPAATTDYRDGQNDSSPKVKQKQSQCPPPPVWKKKKYMSNTFFPKMVSVSLCSSYHTSDVDISDKFSLNSLFNPGGVCGSWLTAKPSLWLSQSGVWAGSWYCSSILQSLLFRVWFRMTSPEQDGSTFILGFWATFFNRGRWPATSSTSCVTLGWW